MTIQNSQILGAGIGFRYPHADDVLNNKPKVGWFEILTENLWTPAKLHHDIVTNLRSNYPLVFHGIGMNLGSTSGVSDDYLLRLTELIQTYQPTWVSDHLCWTAVDGQQSHDLLPLPFNQESIEIVSANINRVQEALKQEILVENITYYHQFEESQLTEWEFISEVCKVSGCSLLLDVNNLYLNSQNQGYDPDHFLSGIDPKKVKQIHLAGHEVREELIIDTHSTPVSKATWSLYQKSLGFFGKIPTNIEWDQDLPDFKILLAECQSIASYLESKV